MRVVPYLIALVLGAGVATLSACGSSSSPALIPASQAGPLRDDFAQVASAVSSGDCNSAQNAVNQAQNDLDDLSSKVSPALVKRIQEGIDALKTQAPAECLNQSQSVTTDTTDTTTTTPVDTTPTPVETTTTTQTPVVTTPETTATTPLTTPTTTTTPTTATTFTTPTTETTATTQTTGGATDTTTQATTPATTPLTTPATTPADTQTTVTTTPDAGGATPTAPTDGTGGDVVPQ